MSSIGAILFAVCVILVTAGVVWFHIVRPILEDYGFLSVEESEPESVNTSQAVMSRDQEPRSADEADRQADRPSVSADDLHVERLQLDRSKTALIELMVYNGWQVGEIRAVLKGDNGAIGAEVEQARQRLGLSAPERQLRVKDERGERLIPMS